MADVKIHLKENEHHFVVGDTIEGTAEVTLPEEIPLHNVFVSFHCVGEVRWVEYPGTAYYQNGYVYNDKFDFYEKLLNFSHDEVKVEPLNHLKKAHIAFSFTIPKDQNLPSTMISTHGSIQYFVRVAIQDKEEVHKYVEKIIVQSPFEKDLMITVGGTVEKNVILHGGNVSMHASIGRKGFSAGETITVHVAVDNKTNAKVVPRITLNQVQIFMCGTRHKTIENVLTVVPVIGAEVQPHTQVEEVLDVQIPDDKSLSIKSPVITVKYFVRVQLDIPHSLDLHLNLPVVVTSKRLIDQLKQDKDQPELLSK